MMKIKRSVAALAMGAALGSSWTFAGATAVNLSGDSWSTPQPHAVVAGDSWSKATASPDGDSWS